MSLSAPLSLAGRRSPTSASARRASSLASFRSFFVLDSVITLSRQGFATCARNPASRASSSVHRQRVPVSNTTAAPLSCAARSFLGPSRVVGIVVSITVFGLPPAFDMTQTCVFLSLTSMPIVV